jgi:hypothetical protein
VATQVAACGCRASLECRPPAADRKGFTVKKLIVVIALVAIAAFAFSKLTAQKEEHEFGV